MSKKSRRRNKKILAALALAGGAAMLGRRGSPAAANIDSGRGSGLRDTVDSTQNLITKTKDVLPLPKKVINKGSQTRFTTKGADGVWRGPMEHKRHMDSIAGNLVPPSMRGGAETAQGFVRKVPIRSGTRGGKGAVTHGWTTQPYKKGGRVTGIAKRGFGRALMKGKK
mgnify:CR=1 FL=1